MMQAINNPIPVLANPSFRRADYRLTVSGPAPALLQDHLMYAKQLVDAYMLFRAYPNCAELYHGLYWQDEIRDGVRLLCACAQVMAPVQRLHGMLPCADFADLLADPLVRWILACQPDACLPSLRACRSFMLRTIVDQRLNTAERMAWVDLAEARLPALAEDALGVDRLITAVFGEMNPTETRTSRNRS